MFRDYCFNGKTENQYNQRDLDKTYKCDVWGHVLLGIRPEKSFTDRVANLQTSQKVRYTR